MKAVILAAGMGTRMRPYTLNLPKVLLTYNNKTLLEQHISALHSCGINDITIITGYLSELIDNKNVKIIYNQDFNNTNMSYSFYKAKELFNDDLLVVYGDIAYKPNLLTKILSCEKDVCVLTDDLWHEYWMKRYGNIESDLETLILGTDNLIKNIGKFTMNPDYMESRYIGIIKFSKFSLNLLNKIYFNSSYPASNHRNDFITDILQLLIENNLPIYATRVKGGWIEFDTKEDFLLSANYEL